MAPIVNATPQEIFNLPLTESFLVIDCRERELYDQGHLVSALSFPTQSAVVGIEDVKSILCPQIQDNPPDRTDTVVLYTSASQENDSHFSQFSKLICENRGELFGSYFAPRHFRVLVLRGGFEAFFAEFPFLCAPSLTLENCPFYPRQVDEEIFIGSRAVCNESAIKNLKITHLVSCVANDMSPPCKMENFLHIKMEDSESEDLMGPINSFFGFIKPQEMHGKRVLVHCDQGRSRSASLVLAYLMQKHQICFEDALFMLQQQHPSASPNRSFQTQLARLQHIFCPNLTTPIPLPSKQTELWNTFSSQICNAPQTANTILELSNQFSEIHQRQIELSGLAQAVEWMQDCVQGFDFFGVVLPHVIAIAGEMPELFPNGTCSTLVANRSAVVELSRRQCLCLVAHSFFGTLKQVEPFGNMSFLSILQSSSKVGIERVKCLLQYFFNTARSPPSHDLNDAVKFSRHVLENSPEWRAPSTKTTDSNDSTFLQLMPPITVSHTTSIEDSADTNCLVDFANKHIHIFSIIPSATQEEVLFSLYPECFVSLLFCATMEENEAILLENVEKHASYTGYGRTFCFSANQPSPNNTKTTIIAIDAIFNFGLRQFTHDAVFRDLNKAFVGFNAVAATTESNGISTGNWGCGVFNGDPILKFVQQLCAAAACTNTGKPNVFGKPLHYSTFGDDVLAQKIQNLHRKFVEKNVTVGDLVTKLLEFSRVVENTDITLDEYLIAWLK